jgi:hypothetical protein
MSIYFNEMFFRRTTSDVQIVVNANSGEQTELICSYQVAKQLAINLSDLISELENDIEYEIVPVLEIQKRVRRNAD